MSKVELYERIRLAGRDEGLSIRGSGGPVQGASPGRAAGVERPGAGFSEVCPNWDLGPKSRYLGS